MNRSKSTFMDRLMGVLERAGKQNFEIEVKGSFFLLKDRDDARKDAREISPVWNDESDLLLADIEVDVEIKEAEAARFEVMNNLRNRALSKLSDEEQEALRFLGM